MCRPETGVLDCETLLDNMFEHHWWFVALVVLLAALFID